MASIADATIATNADPYWVLLFGRVSLRAKAG
jgi:hypothetical protein